MRRADHPPGRTGTGREDHPFPATRLVTSHDGRHSDASSVPTIPNESDGGSGLSRAGWLGLSRERDRALRLRLNASREGYAAGRDDGWRDGFDDGWTASERMAERAHRLDAAAVLETPQQARASAERRVRAAEAGCRRDAAQQWRSWYARARGEL